MNTQACVESHTSLCVILTTQACVELTQDHVSIIKYTSLCYKNHKPCLVFTQD